jgi:hypothetical protein
VEPIKKWQFEIEDEKLDPYLNSEEKIAKKLSLHV